MSKITALTTLAAPAPDDVLPVTDVHDTTMAASGTTKQITVASLIALVPTAIKTTAYTAAVYDFVPCDTATTGAFTVTLPTAPADKSIIAVKMVKQASARLVTIAAGGSDVFNVAGGAVTRPLTLLFEGVILQYKAAGAIWYVTADDLPLSQTDSRYAALAGATFTGWQAPAVVALTDASTITVDASKGNDMRVTLTASGHTLGAPSSPVDGQELLFQVTQDGTGSRTLAYASGAGGYSFSAQLPSPTLSVTPGAVDLLKFIYNATKNRWLFCAYLGGF